MRLKTPLLLTLCIASASALADQTRSGRAQVEWVSSTIGYTPGEPLVTALKMVLDEGWHTYWINPGEAGLPLTADLTLPEGWSADAPEHPLPMRFMTGNLHDFGYEGTVLFPITLHPPAEAVGDVEIKGSFDWLTCDDSACIPGDATLTLALKANDNTPTQSSEEISKTLQNVPTPATDGWKLHLTESAESLDLQLTIPSTITPEKLEVFPLTANIAHPGASYDWKSQDGQWHATIPKSPFAPEPIEQFELVVHTPSMDRPAIVTWKVD